jgi:eukaryotic-like serine/threonine-protein kinase
MAMHEHLLGLAEKRVGELLRDKWRLERVLGIGGMGSVFEARHKNGKRVAVKILHPHLAADPRVQKRFLREGYVANSLVHPSVVGIDDNDIDAQGNPFLVMELLRGQSLEARRIAAGGRLGVAEMLPIFAHLLDVLILADDQGIVHRDLKPENLFLLDDGSLRVVDFGLARAREVGLSTSGAMTNPDELMGTPGFMAPEQAIGRWDLVDPKTDVWAAGATMFTVFAGRPVHHGASVPLLLVSAATKKAPPLASVAEGVPPEIAAVVDHALTFSKAERPDARTVLAELTRAAHDLGMPLPALPIRPRPARSADAHGDDDENEDEARASSAEDTDPGSGSIPRPGRGPGSVPGQATPSDPFAPTIHSTDDGRGSSPLSWPPSLSAMSERRPPTAETDNRPSSLQGVVHFGDSAQPAPAPAQPAPSTPAPVGSPPAPRRRPFPLAVVPVALAATLAGAALAGLFLRPTPRLAGAAGPSSAAGEQPALSPAASIAASPSAPLPSADVQATAPSASISASSHVPALGRTALAATSAIAVAPAKSTASKLERGKTDSTKTDSTKTDSTKTDSTKTDSTKTDSTKTDSTPGSGDASPLDLRK